MEKSVERSFQGQHDGKDDSTKDKKRPAAASSKLGAARCSNRDKVVGIGHRLEKYQQQSNVAQGSKLHQEPVMNRKFQKTVGPVAKDSSVYNLRSKKSITEGASSYNLRSEVHKPEDRNASVNFQNRKTPKKDSSKDSSVAILKNSTKPIKKIETPEPVTASPAKMQNRKTPKEDSSKSSPVAMQKREILKNSTKPIMKIETPKPATASPANIQNRKTPKEDSSKASSVAKQKRKILESSTKPIKRIETPKPLTASLAYNQIRKKRKEDCAKASSVTMQKRCILKNYSKPLKKIETPKPITASPADLDRKNHPLTSQHELFLREPIYHIRWEGDDVENGPSGHICVFCNKDLSLAAEDDDDDDDDDDEYDDDFQYDVDDGYYDEYDHNPPLLPVVDILSCGHAYHTECLQKGTHKEQLSDPQCVVCYKTS